MRPQGHTYTNRTARPDLHRQRHIDGPTRPLGSTYTDRAARPDLHYIDGGIKNEAPTVPVASASEASRVQLMES
jgi:hypothetical protein